MTKVVIPPFAYHAGQRRLLAERRRFNVACCGRRFGKTMFGLEQILFEPGGAVDGRPVAWLSPSYKLLIEVWKDAERSTGKLVRTANKTDMRIELVTGGVIDFWTLEDTDAGRGRKYARIVVDEAAHARYLQDAWEQAILPTLTDFRGEAWFISTPAGRNYFWELYQLGSEDSGRRHPDWQSWRMPTATNPHIAAAEIERMRELLPERIFAQEYEAAFLESGGGVFRRIADAIDSTLPTDPHLAKADGGRAYVIGIDWGRHNDYTVFCVVDATSKSVVALDRFTQIEYAFQLSRLRALAERFPRAPVVAEANSMGGPLIEQLRRDGLPVQAFLTTAASKSQAIEALALSFERGEIRIPNVPALVDELMAFDQERLPSGSIRYGAPSGAHDDCVMALAIAWHGVGQQGGYYGARAASGTKWQL